MSKTTKAVEKSDDTTAAELEALEASLAALENEDSEDIVEAAPSEEDISAAISEVELEEAKKEAYAEQDEGTAVADEDEVATKKKVAKEKKAPRKTMIGAKKSEVILDKLGEKADGFFVLETSSEELTSADIAKRQEEVLQNIDRAAKKVGEKAVNLIGVLNGTGKLSAYTAQAFEFLVKSETPISTSDLIRHFNTGGGGKPYSLGTARSQTHQIFQLFPQLRIGILKDKKMSLNPDSVYAGKLVDILGL